MTSETKEFSMTRRTMLHSAAAAAASAAVPGIASAAIAAGSSGLRTYRGRYALPGGRIVHGYFVAPAGRTALDTLVLLPGERGLDAATQARARNYAAGGRLVVVPDLAATFTGTAALRGRSAHIASLRALAPCFGRRTHANGRVAYVLA